MRNRTKYDETYVKLQSEFFLNKRKESGRSYENVAYFLGINSSTYYRYENGSRDMPISVFIDLCRFYDLDYAKVFKDLNKETIRICGKTASEER